MIVKHESEWANPSKWQPLFNEIIKQTGTAAQHKEEQKRINKLMWWDEVKASVPGFPGAEVFHINPVALVGNFYRGKPQTFQFTIAMFKRLFPNANVNTLQELVDEFNSHIDFYKLDTPLRMVHFFAQVIQETGPSLPLEEGFVWKASALISTFLYFRQNPHLAVKHGYDKKSPIKADGMQMTQADYEAIANGAYGGRMKNGDSKSGDGWKYRGRGMKQLTGRSNYREFANWHKHHQSEWPENVANFEDNPDLLTKPKYAARSAAYFWVKHRLYEIADQGANEKQVNDITEVINRGTDSGPARIKHFKSIYANGDFN